MARAHVQYLFNLGLSAYQVNLGFEHQVMARAPKMQLVWREGEKGGLEVTVSFYLFIFLAQHSRVSIRPRDSDLIQAAWSPPLNAGNCINQHISPRAESISSTPGCLP